MPLPDLEQLIVRVDALINTMYAVKDVLSIEPSKQHVVTCINYADLQEMRAHFISELVNTVTAFVYSEASQEKIIESLIGEGRSRSSAWSALTSRACSKFRHSSLKGQFSELILCNLLQHYFKAAPLLRKMRITTNPSLERNGADAIHVAWRNNSYVLYIGEAKTYNRKSNCLRDALVDSTRGVIEHYNDHRSELMLYTYEDFITPDLEGFARRYMNGEEESTEVHLICIATYNCSRDVGGDSRAKILESIICNVRAELDDVKGHPVFSEIPVNLRPRINYILFSVREMDSLIEEFTRRVNSGS